MDLGDPLSTALSSGVGYSGARLIVAEVTRTQRRQGLGESFFSGLYVEGNLFRQHPSLSLSRTLGRVSILVVVYLELGNTRCCDRWLLLRRISIR